jgi:hypothetical protein
MINDDQRLSASHGAMTEQELARSNVLSQLEAGTQERILNSGEQADRAVSSVRWPDSLSPSQIVVPSVTRPSQVPWRTSERRSRSMTAGFRNRASHVRILPVAQHKRAGETHSAVSQSHTDWSAWGYAWCELLAT